MMAQWQRLRQEWLHQKFSRSSSIHTRSAYQESTEQWMNFLDSINTAPWQASARHVRLWIRHLEENGLAPSTINARLAACSSWYAFMMAELDGQITNPFAATTVQRRQIRPYRRARVIAPGDLNLLLRHLETRRHSLIGSRNYALLLTYLLTGWRNTEVITMRWGNIRASRSQPGAYIYRWTGKGGKTMDDPLPGRCYEAIMEHLMIAGRLDDMSADDYIWQPLMSHGIVNLRNQADRPATNGHISGRRALDILRRSLRAAGVTNWRNYRIHDLRHTFAHAFYRQYGDLEKLRRLLHHESLNTTGVYIRELTDPVDDWSNQLYDAWLHSE